MIFYTENIVTVSGRFIGICGVYANEFQIPAPRNLWVSQLRLLTRTPGVGSGSARYTLRINGVDTALSILVAVTQSGVQVVQSITGEDLFIPEGALVGMRVDFEGTVSTGPTEVTISLS